MATLTASEINLSTLGKLSEEGARKLLEKLRWPHGPVCPHCGVIGEATRMESSEESETQLRAGILNCRACRKPFTVTVGTIFEGSHIPLSKWLIGFFLFASAKKSMSAAQLQRQLGLGSYRTAWHMAHRIRHAMQNDLDPAKLSGTLEADETYVGGKVRKGFTKRDPNLPLAEAKWKRRSDGQKAMLDKRIPVAVLVSRDGQARARAMDKVTIANLKGFLKANADVANSTLHTDEANAYREVGREFGGGHVTTEHGKGEYARGKVHSNTVEAFNGLFKRSIQGSWHHISREHIDRYLAEQCFRWSNRKVTDGERAVTALGQVAGVRLFYRTPQARKAGSAGLVAGR